MKKADLNFKKTLEDVWFIFAYKFSSYHSKFYQQKIEKLQRSVRNNSNSNVDEQPEKNENCYSVMYWLTATGVISTILVAETN